MINSTGFLFRMKLFKYEGYKVVISEEAYALKVFRQIWNRDKTASKDRAIMELGYIYFMIDPRSDYQYIVDTDDRSKAIIEGEGLPSKWKPDKCVIEAMKFYESFKTTSALILEDTRKVAENLRKALPTINIMEEDDKGRPKYTISSITKAIRELNVLVKELAETEKVIAKEMAESNGRVRGQKAKTILEDGL